MSESKKNTEKKIFTRRDFLAGSLAILAAGALSSCGPKSTTGESTTSSSTQTTPVSTSTQTTSTSTSTSTQTTPTSTSTQTSTSIQTTTTSSTTSSITTGAKKPVYLGGTFSLTGAYAEDCTAVLAGYEDYIKYVNETGLLAPWRTDAKLPVDISVKLLWRDDELRIDKALSIYDELKGKGLLVERVSGSGQALALMSALNRDNIGATSQAVGAYLLSPPQTIFTYYPIYTDDLAAIADWFLDNWKESRKPRYATITADSPFGRSIDIPQMEAYLTGIGYEYVGSQFVPVVPTSPPTTQLLWLRDKKVDLALGAMVNPGSQPTIKEATRLGMGPNLEYKITFGFAAPSHLAIFVPAMGKLGDGTVVAGSFPTLTDTSIEGIKFCSDLLTKYRPKVTMTNVMYEAGIMEAMIQLEAIRLALQTVPYEKLTSADILEKGFYQIKNFSTGGMSSTPIKYAKGKVEGVDEVRIDQAQNGKVVNLGTKPCRHIIVPEEELW
jgi:hypothetical protein